MGCNSVGLWSIPNVALFGLNGKLIVYLPGGALVVVFRRNYDVDDNVCVMILRRLAGAASILSNGVDETVPLDLSDLKIVLLRRDGDDTLEVLERNHLVLVTVESQDVVDAFSARAFVELSQNRQEPVILQAAFVLAA